MLNALISSHINGHIPEFEGSLRVGDVIELDSGVTGAGNTCAGMIRKLKQLASGNEGIVKAP